MLKQIVSFGLAMAMTLSMGAAFPAPVLAAEAQPEDLVKPTTTVTVSSGENAAYAVDGETQRTEQWTSADMKTNATKPEDEQKHQWLTVDLGENFAPVPAGTIKLYYNMKVWPMVYKVQTSANNKDWTELVSVSRKPFDGAVKNGEGQNIAIETNNSDPKTAANVDVITKTSVPALAQNAKIQRYVRFYVEKVNTDAPGMFACVRSKSTPAKNPTRTRVVQPSLPGTWQKNSR